MSGKITRAAFQQLIAEDIVWLEAQPRTLEREHIIAIVRESERYYYDEAQDEAIKAAHLHGLRPLEEFERRELHKSVMRFVLIAGGSTDALMTRSSAAYKARQNEKTVLEASVNAILERRQGHP